MGYFRKRAMHMDEYMTIREVKDLLKVSERTVRRWIGRGELPALKIGRSVRIRREDIDLHFRATDGQTIPGRDAQFEVLTKARQFRHKLAARQVGTSGNSVETLREIRLERAHGR